MALVNINSTLEKCLKNPEFKKEYEALDDEFKAIEALIDARLKAKLTQKDVAKKMGISQSSVARIESGALNIRYKTLLSYLRACGSEIVFRKSKVAL